MQNLFIDKIRRTKARREDLTADPIAAPVPEDHAWWESITVEQVKRQLTRLSAEQRQTFELFALEGKSYDQIAATLGIAKATVGTRILRARQKIRELLIEERGDA